MSAVADLINLANANGSSWYALLALSTQSPQHHLPQMFLLSG